MENYVPMHECRVHKISIIVNRTHAILHSIAILFLIHYRLSFFFQHPPNITIPTLPWLLIFVSELLLCLAWLLTQFYRWRPVYRTVFPERLPADDKLPAIDVFICTADPNKEPSVEVMNTVISAMALDYPPEKLHVYVSDDAGSDATLRCTKEAWNFARYWVPFCRKYGLVTACPDVYFSSSEDSFKGSSEFKAERKKMEVINEYHKEKDEVKIPILVYVSREKRPSHHHNFKAGALNVLIQWHGFDGAGGPTISDLMALKRSFGPSNDFIKTLVEDYKPCFIKDGESSRMLLEHANVLASCSYEDQTTWGTKVGFLYFCVLEDYFTGFTLHRKEVACMPLLCCLSVWGFALIPQLCLFNGIPLYPKISDSNFNIFSIIFISAISKSLYDIVTTGDQFRVWKNEWRIWMVRSVTCYTYGSLDAILNKLGIKEASFLPTNKVTDDEQFKLYEMGIFDFRAATMFLAPLVVVILVNFAAFVGAVFKALVVDDNGDRDDYKERQG
ncbi:hypothetical protein GOBAR_AA28155 [Gossypium barbadense]|uniref:Glycosyltransferase 2-like domain-containing protein n=1 Tax=Gossypium barbadense TaxID=3634 RepID=A0A2P5WNA4_GOSBA|nr:hypothetical protein GOBAR_AA28155 [Gossypium barbadense]